MFEDSLYKFFDYRKRRFDKKESLSGYDAEIGHKLMQLNWLIAKAQRLNNAVVDAAKEGKHASEEFYELQIITECFYYFVGRLTELFSRNSNFGNIPRSNAENIRHQLLQHPETQKERQKPSPSFECGANEGPKIKSYTGPDGAMVDAGMFLNASEFNEKLCIVFDREAEKA